MQQQYMNFILVGQILPNKTHFKSAAPTLASSLGLSNLHNYFNIHVCPSLRRRRRRRPSRPVPSHFRVSSYSEFQMPSQTAAERGEAELRILHFKTTWSEFQKPC